MEKTQFENYFKNYYALVFRIAFSELKSHADADDIVQDVFLSYCFISRHLKAQNMKRHG